MLIKMKDYERIYKTINAIILNEGADPTVSCTFFAFYGAKILKDHYKIDAKAVAGSCCYHLGNDNALTFGEFSGDELVSNSNAFHGWIIAEGWLVDFMAPVFPDIMKKQNPNLSLPSKMMQKRIEQMSSEVINLGESGEFYFLIDPEMIKDRVSYLSSSPAFADLAYICSKWYKKPPKKMIKAIPISDGKGTERMVSLSGRAISAAW